MMLFGFPTHVGLLWLMGGNVVGFSIRAEIASRTETLTTATYDSIEMSTLRDKG
jgi:hypothetical protein